MNTRFARLSLLIPCLSGLIAPLAGAGETKPTKATVRSADGLSIAYEVRGKGDTALIFLHGWCGDREYWKHQVNAFAGEYRIVALDLAGHGESGKDRCQSRRGRRSGRQGSRSEAGYPRWPLDGRAGFARR